jgi:hypothetical protein
MNHTLLGVLNNSQQYEIPYQIQQRILILISRVALDPTQLVINSTTQLVSSTGPREDIDRSKSRVPVLAVLT